MKEMSKKITLCLLILSMIFPTALVVTTAGQAMAADSTTAGEEGVALKVRLSKNKLKIYKGKTKKLALKNAVGKVKWKSKDKKIAGVNSKGKVIARKKGKTTITATYNGKKYKCKITVYEKKGSSNSSRKSEGSGDSSGYLGSGTVYWTPSGEVYHSTSECPTLSRSRTIYSGSVSESGKSRKCKVCF